MREFTILTSPQTDAKDPCLRANFRKLIADSRMSPSKILWLMAIFKLKCLEPNAVDLKQFIPFLLQALLTSTKPGGILRQR